MICSFYHHPLCDKAMEIFGKCFSSSVSFRLNLGSHRNDLQAPSKYELSNLPNTQVKVAKDVGKNYLKSDLLSSVIFHVIVYSSLLLSNVTQL